ncbi:tetratricopeptide repeat protein [Legionella massiliensis]|nr:tetratricopeptide repeat protein [Legionella massiliensis]
MIEAVNNYAITPETICSVYAQALKLAEKTTSEWRVQNRWYALACLKLGKFYQDGFGTPKSEIQAYGHYLEAASLANIPEAHFQAAFLLLANYEKLMPGRTLEDAQKQAFNWHYKIFANQNIGQHAAGLTKLADCYFRGIGTEPNRTLAIEYYKRADALGYRIATMRLAELYETEQNHKLAFEYYYKAREASHQAAYKAGFYMEQFYGAKDFTVSVSISRETVYELYKTAASKGNDQARFALVRCLELGFGIKQDRPLAYDKYMQLANAGNLDARYRAALLLSDDIRSTTLDCKTEAFTKHFSVFKGTTHTEGLCALAKCYQTGTGTKTDLIEAFICYKQAADLGSAEAMYNLFLCYRDGLGIQKDMNLALSWCERASQQNYIPAVYSTALNIIDGLDTKTAKEKVIPLLEQASQSITDAITVLGQCYERGFGVEKNEKQALEYFHEAFAKECPRAALELGLYNKREGYFSSAHSYFVFASKAGYVPAFFYLGESLKNGWGPSGFDKEIREKEIFDNFKKAYEKNNAHTEAMFHLGWCYEHDIGCDSDLMKELNTQKSFKPKKELALKKAFELYEKAAKNPYLGQASFALGLCYMYGKGTETNKEKAKDLFIAASKQGIDEAYFELGLLYDERGKPNKAFEYYLNYAQAVHHKRKLFLDHCDKEQSLLMESQKLSEQEPLPRLKPLLPVNNKDVFSALLIPASPMLSTPEKNIPAEDPSELIFKTARIFSGVVERLYKNSLPPTFQSFFSEKTPEETRRIAREYHENLVKPQKSSLKAEIFLKIALSKNHPEAALRLGDFYSGLCFSTGEDIGSSEPDIFLALEYYEQSSHPIAKERLKDPSVLREESYWVEFFKKACDQSLKWIETLTAPEKSLNAAEKSDLRNTQEKVQNIQYKLGKYYSRKAERAETAKSSQFFPSPNEREQFMEEAKKYFQMAADQGHEESINALHDLNALSVVALQN